jgi:PAS domain S-box-containing protein
MFSRQAAVVFLVCVVLCLTIIGLTVRQIDVERDRAISNELDSNALLAQTQESRVSNALQILDQVLLVLRDDYAIHGKPKSLNQRLAAMHVDRNYVGIVSLISETGDVIATTAQGMNINFADREYFKEHASDPTDQLLIGKPILGRLTGKTLISLTRRINHPDGTFAGLVFLALDPVFLAPDYSGIKLERDATITLVGLDGIVRVRQNNGSNSFGEDVRAGQILHELRKSPSGKFISVTPIDGQRRATGYRKLAEHPLVVLVGSSTQHVTDSLLRSERVSMLSAALACLLVVGLAGAIIRAFSQSQKQLDEVAANAEKLRAIIDVLPVPMALNDRQGNITSLNRAFTETYGYALAEIPTLEAWWDLACPEANYRQWVMDSWRVELKWSQELGNRFTPFEIKLRCKDGSCKTAVASAANYSNSEDAEHLLVLFDITQREATEQALQASLNEKEALLKEVHHRVKNNLQLITSLIRLEVGRSDQAEVKGVLGEMQGRIRSMALLHESLYREGSFASVDLSRYIGQLASQIFSANLSRNAPIELRLELAAVSAGLDQAIPCGLLVNELITNSLKHGFPQGRAGSVTVALRPAQDVSNWRLSVSDTGVGVPEDFESRRQNSLGLQLASGLANQLGGELSVESGASFAVSFRILSPDSTAKSS